MEKETVKKFFDSCASGWDADMVRNDEIINRILDGAEVSEGKDILDVACGTGVLIPDYLERNVASVTGIDMSSQMIRIARSKFSQENVSFLCGDAEQTDYGRLYDCIMIYNAFPHFPDPAGIVTRLCEFLKPGGTLTVAHGMSRAALDAHHKNLTGDISLRLINEKVLAGLFPLDIEVTVIISDDEMYQVTGRKTK